MTPPLLLFCVCVFRQPADFAMASIDSDHTYISGWYSFFLSCFAAPRWHNDLPPAICAPSFHVNLGYLRQRDVKHTGTARLDPECIEQSVAMPGTEPRVETHFTALTGSGSLKRGSERSRL